MAKSIKGCLVLRRGRYYADWSFNGKRYRVSTGESTEREARKRLAEIVANFTKEHTTEAVLESVKESLQRATRRNLRIADAFPIYEKNKLRDPITENTMRGYRAHFKAFAEWAEGRAENIDDVSPEMARRFMSHVAETASPKTFNDYLSSLSLVWRTLISEGFAAQNPWAWDKDLGRGIKRKARDTHRHEEFSAEQLSAIFVATSGEMRTLFFIGIYTGLRLKDCALLKWDAVDLAGGFIRLTPEKTRRHGIAVSIPILPPLAEALRAARKSGGETGGYVLPEMAGCYLSQGANCRGGKTYGAALCSRVRTVLKRAGIVASVTADGRHRRVTDYGFHSLRHTFVSMAARAGIRQEVVRAIVGHTSATMTDYYTHTKEADLRAAMAAFPAIGTERPQEHAGGGEVIEIPAEAGRPAETRLAELARLLAEMAGDEWDEAARIFKAEAERRATA